MPKASEKIDLARASKEDLIAYLEKAKITIDENLPVPQLRERAMEVYQTLKAAKADDDLEKRAKAASSAILSDGDDDTADADLDGDVIADLVGNTGKPTKKKFDIESLEVFPEDGVAGSINDIIDDSAKGGEEMETVEERILREHQEKKNDLRTARLVAAADASIREYHSNAIQKHGARLTNVCFFLKSGMHLSSFSTPYTKINGFRLRRATPYRALDVELKLFRTKRKMFGECAYEGADQAVAPVGKAKAKNK